MLLHQAEQWARWLGAAAALGTLAVLLLAIGQGLRRTTADRRFYALYYTVISLGFFGLCIALWRPLPIVLPPAGRALALLLGVPLYFWGLLFVLWGRWALAEVYNVSSAFGAWLYPDHRLITTGPFALVRHPMYLGVEMAAVGGLLLYRTWTCAFLVIAFLGLIWRARREEQALAAEFGGQWRSYSRQTPAWLPRIWRNRR
jgi:protein-S-isoprenylcysteine O-methyltransferase Ste14